MASLRVYLASLFLSLTCAVEGNESENWIFQSVAGQTVGLSFTDDQITWISGHKKVSTNDCKTEDLLICFQIQEFLFALPLKENMHQDQDFMAGSYRIRLGYRLDEHNILGVKLSDIRVYYIYPNAGPTDNPIAAFHYANQHGLVAFYALNAEMKNLFIYSGKLPGPFAKSSSIEIDR